jgi:hypothetical protein
MIDHIFVSKTLDGLFHVYFCSKNGVRFKVKIDMSCVNIPNVYPLGNNRTLLMLK